MTERLTDEQVAEVLRNCRLLPHDFMPVYRAPERCMSCPLPPSQHPVVAHSHSMLADALTQVSADLSAAKADAQGWAVAVDCRGGTDCTEEAETGERCWTHEQRRVEAKLSALQEKARELDHYLRDQDGYVLPIGYGEPSQRGHVTGVVTRLLSGLRSLLPEEGR